MFGSKERPTHSTHSDTGPAVRSHIAAGMSVKGDIEGDIDLLLDGRLEGNLRCRSVTIGKSGEVIGRVVAQEAIVDGKVEGDVEAKTVRLNVTAVMIGDVRHDVIEVAAGASIEGRYSRINGKAASKPVVRSSHKTDTADAPPKAPATGGSAKETAKDKDTETSAASQTGEVVPMGSGAKAN